MMGPFTHTHRGEKRLSIRSVGRRPEVLLGAAGEWRGGLGACLERGNFFLFLHFFCEIELISLKFMHDSCEIPALQTSPVVIIGRHVKETEK